MQRDSHEAVEIETAEADFETCAGIAMRTPFDYLGDLLERLHKRSPIAAYFVAVLIAAGATYVIALLNQDGMSVPRVWGA